MDVARFAQVLWRFRLLVAGGLVLALALAALSTLRIGFDGWTPTVKYRQAEIWRSSATLFVTQEGFPWGRSILDEVITVDAGNGPTAPGDDRPTAPGDNRPTYPPKFADAGRFSGLALLYANFAQGDAVRRSLLSERGIEGTYTAEPLASAGGQHILPMVLITAQAATPGSAVRLANRVSIALEKYLQRRQNAGGVPLDRRVQVEVVSRARGAELLGGRTAVRPVFLFILVATIVVGLAFLLDNLRPLREPQNRVPLPARAETWRQAGEA